MRRPRRARPQLVELEDRVTPATLFTVTGAGDDNTRDGVLTLREALLAQRGDITLSADELVHVAVNAPGLTRDTIGFAPVLGGRTITFGASDTTAANRYGATGFVVTTPVTIDGTAGGGQGVTVSGGSARRLFAVTSTGDLGLANLTLADGLAQGGAGGVGATISKGTTTTLQGGGGGGAAGLGGAVFVDGGVLTITAGTLTGNRAAGGAGGYRGTSGSGAGGTGTYLSTGGAGIPGASGGAGGFGGGGGGGGARSTTTHYPPPLPPGHPLGGITTSPPPPPVTTYDAYAGGAGGFGGGAGASGVATFGLVGGWGGGGAGFGGAVFNNAGTVTITSSTLTANTAVGGPGGTAGKGHGGAVFSRNGTLTITSSTLSANTAAQGGAGVFVLADKVVGGAGDTGSTGAAAVTITGSILGQTANAVTDLATATNGSATTLTVSGAFNLIRNTAVTGVGNLSTADPRLTSFATFGGPTRTMALLTGSPALDAGDPAATGADQRGVAVYNGRRDVGAFEQAAGTLTIAGPGTLPSRSVGEAYNETFAAAGSAGPFTFAVYDGALPAGLTLSPAGVLSGTATAGGTFTFTVIAHDPTGASGSRDYTLVVVPPVVLTPTALPGAAVEAAYSQALSASGPAGPFTFAVTTGSLPAGLTLTGAGVLAGTPTAAGTATFTVAATSAGGYTGTRQYTVVVGPVTVAVGPATLAAATRGTAYSQAVTAAGAIGPFTFAVTAGSLPPGLTLAADGALTGTVPPGATQSFAFTVTATSATGFAGTRQYTVAANSPVAVEPTTVFGTIPGATLGTPFSQQFTASGAAGPFTFAVSAGSLPAGLALSAGGALTGTPTALGAAYFTVTATSPAGHVGSRSYILTVVAPGPSLSPAALPAATVGQAYSQSVRLTGVSGTFTYGLTGGTLPPGLSFVTQTIFGSSMGILTGTPTAAGTYTFRLSASSTTGAGGSQTYTFVVNPAGVTLTPATLPAGAVEATYAQTLTASGGTAPYTFAVTAGSLPAGLTLTAAGDLAGTPTAVGTATFTVTATAANGSTGTRSYTLTVGPATVVVGPATLPPATRGVAYAQTLTGSGSAAPYTFAVTAGSLPPGLELAANGTLTGTVPPGATQTFTFTVTGTSATGVTGSRAYSLEVNSPLVLAPAAGALPAASQGQPYTQTFTATGAAGPFAFALSAGTLPAGLSLDADGTLAGTPTAGGNFAFTVTATSAAGYTASRAYTLAAYATTLVVTSLADDGSPGTLRSVLATANATPGSLPVAVTFAVDGTITLGGTSSAPAGPVALWHADESAADAAGTNHGTLEGTVTYATGRVGQAFKFTGSTGAVRMGTDALRQPFAALTMTAWVNPTATGSSGNAYGLTVLSRTDGDGFALRVLAGKLQADLRLAGGDYTVTFPGQTTNLPLNAWSHLAVTYDGAVITGYVNGVSVGTVAATGALRAANPTTNLLIGNEPQEGSLQGAGFPWPGMLDEVAVYDRALTAAEVQGAAAAGGAAAAQLAITRTSGPILIDGTGRSVTISGGGRTRILQTGAGTKVGLTRLTLTGGNGSGGGSEGAGGAIASNGTLTLTDVTATGNTARLNGGVIYQHAATLTIVRGTFTNNTAGYSAGAVAQNVGTLVVSASTFANNTSEYGGALYGNGVAAMRVTDSTFTANGATSFGGAIGLETGTTLDVAGSTFSANNGGGGGGGAINFDGPVTVRASTFTGNVGGHGGALRSGATGTLTLTDSTVVGNTASASGGGITNSNVLTLAGSIVAGNAVTAAGGRRDIEGAVTTNAGYNLLGTALQGTTSGTGTVFSDSPGVAALADNGGPTPTMALLPGSAAADANNPANTTVDQRGVAVHNGRRDIGAFEGDGVSVGPGALPAATVGTAFSQALTASGSAGPFTFAVTAGALPAGLTLSAVGVLSGTPTAVGTATFTVTATAAGGGRGLRTYTLVVSPVVVTLTPAALPAAVTSLPYTQTLTASGAAGPYTFAVTAGELPAGLTLSASGVLSGTPLADGSETFTVTVTSAAGHIGSRTYTLDSGPGLAIVPQYPPAAAVAVAFTEQLEATGAAGPFTFALQEGTLPPGLTLTAAGLLSGTPTSAGRYTFGVAATAANGLPGFQQFTVLVSPGRELTPAAMPQGQAGQRVELTFGLTAATTPYSYAVSSGALPPGLSLSGAVLRGTPTTAGTYSFTVTAIGASGPVSRAYAYRVAAAPVQAPAAYVVTSLADDASPGTLRYAVNTANADTTAAPVTITFAVSGTIVLTGGSIDLTRAGGPIHIDATGRPITLDANHAGRVLYNVATGPVTLTGLTLRNGRTDATTYGDSGAGILNGGVLTLVRVAVLDNEATYSGGGIYNGNTVHLIDSTVAGNTCAYVGGGVYNGTGATLTAVNSTLANNTAGNGGFVFNGGTFTATDCTISGNAARYTGGGVYNGATFSVVGSIVAGNTLIGTGGFGPNVYAGITTDGGHNLLSPELRGEAPAAGDVFSAAPGLDALADNGGPTPTMALLTGSPAIDAGRAADASADQRGVAVQNGRRDVGAYESGYTPPPTPAATTTTTAGATATYDASQTVTLSATVTGVGGTVTFEVTDAAGARVGTTVTAAVSGGSAAAAYTLPGRTAVGAYRVTATYFGDIGYAASSATATLTVAPRALTVTGLTAADKLYDDTTAATLTTGSAALVGVVAGDGVALNVGAAAGTFASRHVGAALPVTVAGLALAGPDAGNYTLAAPALSAAITPRPLTVTATANSKPFDGTTSAAAAPTVAGLQGDDAASFAETYADPAVGSGKVLTPAGVVLDGNGGANYRVTLVSAPTGTISPSVGTDVAVTLPTAVGYGTPVTVSATVTSGAGTPTGAVTFYDDTAGVALGAGVDLGGGVWAYTAGAGQLAAAPLRTIRAVFSPTGPYLAAAATAGVAVAPRPLTVTGLAAADKVYDGTTTAALDTSAAALGRVVAGDDVTLNMTAAAGTFASADAAAGVPVTVSGLAVTGADAANYTLAAPVLAASVARAPVAVALAPVGGTAGRAVALTAAVFGVGGPLSAGTVTFAVLGTTVVAPVVGGVAAATVTLPAATPAGTYAVHAGYSGAANLAPAAATTALALAAAPADPTPVDPTPAAPDPNLVGVTQLAAGADAAGGGTVTVFNPDSSVAATLTPFPGTGVSVRTVTADFNRDGTPDVVAGTGPGATARVKVLDGRTGAVLFEIRPFDDFAGGVFVSAADLTGDGTPELVVTPDQSGGPRVVIYDGSGLAPMASFLGIDDANFRGGARAGVGDVNGDGYADLVVSAGFGGGPRVAVFDGKALAAGRVAHLVDDFFLFEEGLRNGAYVAVGDVDGDGFADVVGGAGPGGASRVLVLSGRALLTAGAGSALAAPVADFFAGDASNRGGVRVAVKNLDGDRFADVVVGDAAGSGSRLRAYRGADFAGGAAPAAFDLDLFPGTFGGVYVG